MTISAPQAIAIFSFSTSSWSCWWWPDVPMLALTLVDSPCPTPIGLKS